MTADFETIRSAIVSGDFSNDQLDDLARAIKFARSQLAARVKRQVGFGSTVQFTSTRSGQVLTGTVEKMAQKYATVMTNQGRWKVPANMLTVIN